MKFELEKGHLRGNKSIILTSTNIKNNLSSNKLNDLIKKSTILEEMLDSKMKSSKSINFKNECFLSKFHVDLGKTCKRGQLAVCTLPSKDHEKENNTITKPENLTATMKDFNFILKLKNRITENSMLSSQSVNER